MYKRYLRAVKSESEARGLITECVDWLQGDYNAIDTYDLAQMYFDLNRSKSELPAVRGLRAVLLSDCLADKTKTWDHHVCMAIVAVLCKEHSFRVEGNLCQ